MFAPPQQEYKRLSSLVLTLTNESDDHQVAWPVKVKGESYVATVHKVQWTDKPKVTYDHSGGQVALDTEKKIKRAEQISLLPVKTAWTTFIQFAEETYGPFKVWVTKDRGQTETSLTQEISPTCWELGMQLPPGHSGSLVWSFGQSDEIVYLGLAWGERTTMEPLQGIGPHADMSTPTKSKLGSQAGVHEMMHKGFQWVSAVAEVVFNVHRLGLVVPGSVINAAE
eukprot:TRINITY_DN494_c0_g1_i1.p1 TRINITY_DN494_c0_g1~~TRINITY_DN494_c0_g1_i1.p1  ORF type:complete len:225 (+),score=5.42 TRINITY_DN494_c0_g1_i1:47-721(+)